MPGQLAKVVREQKREEVARLNRHGYSQIEIAKQVGVSQPQVSYYLKQVAELYRSRAVEERDVLVREKCEQFRDIRREAVMAWDRSQTLTDEGEKKAGDARFLSVVMDTLKAECDLLGLDAPKKSEVLTGNLDLNKLLGAQSAEDPVERQIKEVNAPAIMEGGEAESAPPPPAPGWYGAIKPKPNGKKKH